MDHSMAWTIAFASFICDGEGERQTRPQVPQFRSQSLRRSRPLYSLRIPSCVAHATMSAILPLRIIYKRPNDWNDAWHSRRDSNVNLATAILGAGFLRISLFQFTRTL